MTRGTETTPPTRKRNEHPLFAVPTTHASEPIIQHTTPEKLADYIVYHRSPVAEVLPVFVRIDPFEFIEVLIPELIKGGVGHAVGSVEVGGMGCLRVWRFTGGHSDPPGPPSPYLRKTPPVFIVEFI